MSGTALVTGCAGFLGSHLVYALKQKGFRVLGVDDLSTGHNDETVSEYLENKQLLIADVAGPSFPMQIETYLKLQGLDAFDIDYVFHLASPASPKDYQRDPVATMRANSQGVFNLLEFCHNGMSRLIFASTSEIYGDPTQHPQTESYNGNVSLLGPRSCYDESKRFAETLLYNWNRDRSYSWSRDRGEFTTRHGVVRIFNTYGPGMHMDDGRAIINFLTQAQAGKPLTVYGDGSQTRSFCYVTDMVEAIIRYAMKVELQEPLNVGNPTEYTILQVAKEVNRLFGRDPNYIEFRDLPQDDPKQRCPDITKAREILSWEPQVKLQDGLLKMKEWLLPEQLPFKGLEIREGFRKADRMDAKIRQWRHA